MDNALQGRKLYRVTVDVDYLALAHSKEEALGFLHEAIKEPYAYNFGEAQELGATSCIPDDWEAGSCLYHSGVDDITLGEARNLLFGIVP